MDGFDYVIFLIDPWDQGFERNQEMSGDLRNEWQIERPK